MGITEPFAGDRVGITGEPQVVHAATRTPLQAVSAVSALVAAGVGPIIVSRARPEHADAVRTAYPTTVHHPDAHMLVLGGPDPDGVAASRGGVVITTAATSDPGVAWECTRTLEAVGLRPHVLADVRVSGLQRLMEVREILEAARILIVITGMGEALVPVVAGMVRVPVIAVPTSVGYGAAQDGMTALHGLLAAGTPGVGVVNIDNGLGAALLARRILLAGRSG